MTEYEAHLLQEFEKKLAQMIELTDSLKAEKYELEKKVETLHEEVEKLESENLDLAKRNEKLKLVSAIEGTLGETKEARLKINKMVREIDKCIALLNQ